MAGILRGDIHWADLNTVIGSEQAVEAGATVLLAASVFHFGIIGIGELKDYLRARSVAIF